MVAVRISDQADRALLDALIYIYQDNPVAAFDLIADLQKRIVQTLEVFPEAGARWRGDQRFLTIRHYTFVYRHDAVREEVLVLDVFGPGMDWR